MSSFFSRCLSCGIDLPNGCRFCGELCRERWHAKHSGEAVAIVATDEWPLVRRETMVSGAAERVVPAVSHETVGQTIALRAETEGLGSTVALCAPDELPPSRTHGPYCQCHNCVVDVI